MDEYVSCETCKEPIREGQAVWKRDDKLVGHARCAGSFVMVERNPCKHEHCHNMACDDCGADFS